jgi:hypothetical protein
MAKEQNHRDNPRPQAISRREFIKLAAVSLLAGCRPAQQATITTPPTSAPTDTLAPTAPPTATPAPTSEPTPAVSEIQSKVVRARHAGVWEGDTLVPEAIQHMLDVSITELTGLGDVTAAWASLFAPSERVAIKVNTIATSAFWTHVPLVMAVTERLQDAGIPAEQIVIFDRGNRELKQAGFELNEDGPGVRCYGSELNYTAGADGRHPWTILDTDIRLSDTLLNCDALINMPILKHHNHSGVTFAMKNHFGTFDRPSMFHRPRTGPAIVELNALAPIRDRARLVIGDCLTICPLSRGGWFQAVTGDSILMSLDPVAHDAVGLQILSEAMAAEGNDPTGAVELANSWLAASAELGLGTGDLNHIGLTEVTLG